MLKVCVLVYGKLSWTLGGKVSENKRESVDESKVWLSLNIPLVNYNIS